MDKINTADNVILIAGASGFLGHALTERFNMNGYKIIALSRSSYISTTPCVMWNPKEGFIDLEELAVLAPQGFAAVINLAGENLASKRWNNERMKALRDSRIIATRLLASCINDGAIQTKLFISASATGFYGDRGDEVLTEESPGGSGFLAELCRDWEDAAERDERMDLRVVKLRTGLVLDAHDGALARMLPAFKMGIGGALGSGIHFYPWITLEDFLRAVLFCFEGINSESSISSAVNIVSPNPVRNSEFTAVLARFLKRPALFTVPRIALVAALGQIANKALLTSQRAVPKKLLDAGFEFKYPTIDLAIAHALGYDK
jgi:uncharacterized protein